MLDAHEISYRYRDYVREPLDQGELRSLFAKLAVAPRELLRRRDKAMKELGLAGDEDDATLIAHMADRPTLLQRPIGVTSDGAVVGRPPERLLELVC